MVGDGRTLDPPDWTNINERHFIPAIFDNLIEIDAEYNLVPGLAKSWTPSPDGLSYTFELQPNVVFHDGTPLDAAAVKFNIDRVMDPASNLRHRANFEDLAGVDVTGPLTFKLNLKQPSTPLLATLTEAMGYMSSPTAVKAQGANYASNPVGAGPFQLVEWQRDSRLVLKRFDRYWRQGLPKSGGVIFQPIPDSTVKLTNLRTGSIDMVDEVAAKDALLVERDNTMKLYTLPGGRWPMIRLNTTKPPFNNLALRQAVASAINRDSLIKAAFFGRGRPAFGPISPLYKTLYDPGVEKIGFGYDVAKAKAKLAEGGQPNGFSFQLDIGPTVQRQAELIQADLEAVGIKMEIRSLESAAFTDRLRSKAFDGALGSWTPRPDPDGIMYQHFHSKGLANWCGYSNAKADELLDQTRKIPNGAQRNDLFRQAERVIAEEVPWVFLIFEEVSRASRSVVTGYVPTADTLLQLREVGLPENG